MAAIFFAMVFDSWVITAMLILGVVLSWIATALYARMGIAAARRAAAENRALQSNPHSS